VAKEDDNRIKTLTTELQQAFYAVSSSLYQQAGGDGGPGTPGGPGGPGTPGAPGAGATGGGSTPDDVIDADFTEAK